MQTMSTSKSWLVSSLRARRRPARPGHRRPARSRPAQGRPASIVFGGAQRFVDKYTRVFDFTNTRQNPPDFSDLFFIIESPDCSLTTSSPKTAAVSNLYIRKHRVVNFPAAGSGTTVADGCTMPDGGGEVFESTRARCRQHGVPRLVVSGSAWSLIGRCRTSALICSQFCCGRRRP